MHNTDKKIIEYIVSGSPKNDSTHERGQAGPLHHRTHTVRISEGADCAQYARPRKRVRHHLNTTNILNKYG
mgnify:CR=1 FL=1